MFLCCNVLLIHIWILRGDYTYHSSILKRNLIMWDCLWYKLLKLGIGGPIFNNIKDMYCNTTYNTKVKYSGVFNNNFECNLGVGLRQGESLSPFLFNLFLNDIEAVLESGGFRGVSMSDITIRTLLYADDLLIMSDSTEDLQHWYPCMTTAHGGN